jgi:hypothetical protein
MALSSRFILSSEVGRREKRGKEPGFFGEKKNHAYLPWFLLL